MLKFRYPTLSLRMLRFWTAHSPALRNDSVLLVGASVLVQAQSDYLHLWNYRQNKTEFSEHPESKKHSNPKYPKMDASLVNLVFCAIIKNWNGGND